MEKPAWIIFLFVLIISPLLFGAVHAYAYTLSIMGILLASLLLLAVGCFEVLYGLIRAFSGSGRIWWFSKSTYHSLKDVTGTYINRNHLAGLLEMLLVLAAAYAVSIAGGKQGKAAVSGHSSVLRQRMSQWLASEEKMNKLLLILFFGVLIGIGLIFSASRGGMIGAAAALLCMGALFFSEEPISARASCFCCSLPQPSLTPFISGLSGQ